MWALVAASLAFTTASAQTRFGVKAGLNYVIASQKIEPEPKDAPSTPKGLGMQFGGFAQLSFSDQLGLRPELLFSFRKLVSKDTQTNTLTYQDQQGNQGQGTQTLTTESDTRLSYIEIPAPLCFTPNENLRIMAGPAFGLILSAKTTSDVTQNDKVTIAGQNYDETNFTTTTTKGSTALKPYTKFEVAAVAGMGYTLDMGLDLDLRFYRAIVTSFDLKEGNARNRAWTNMIEFSVGYAFGG